MVRALLNWFAKSARDLPWRRTADPYAIWVSEIMLQQTQVKTVIPYWLRWMDRLPSIAALADAKPESVLKLWEGLGYYSRARNLQKAAQLIVREFSGMFPASHADMLRLPGVGRYTAGAIASIAFNQPEPILDGNVIRVLTRVAGITENPREKKTNEALWSMARELVEAAAVVSPSRKQNPPPFPACSHLNQSLMEHGALICTPRQPLCGECPLQTMCNAFQTKRTGVIPNLGKRAKATPVFMAAAVVQDRGKYLVRKRSPGEVNAGLWEFPNFETGRATVSEGELTALAFQKLGLTVKNLKPLCLIKHSITRYRITVQAWRATSVGDAKEQSHNFRLLGIAQLEKLAFTSAHRKILKKMRIDFLDAA